MNELCFQLRRDQRKQRTVSHLSFSLRRDFPVRFDPRFFPPSRNSYANEFISQKTSPSAFAKSSFPRLTTIILAQFPVTRFTDNARSLSRITAPPTPFFTEPTIDDSKNVGPTTLAEVSIVFSSRGARKTLTRRAHSLVLNFFHFSLPDKQSLHARTQRGEESAVATRFE